MRHLRDLMPALILHALLFVCVMLGAACNQDQRTKTIHASIIAVDVARDGFITWDREHQAQIVEHATSESQGLAELDKYVAKRKPVVDGFQLVYRALALAATQTDEPSLKAALDHAAKLLLDIQRLQSDVQGGT